MTQYKGFDVLELNYNRIGTIAERVSRKFQLLDGLTGARQSDEQAPAPNPVRPFSWVAFDNTERKVMMDFLDARVGRAVPFWLPSFQWDLRLDAELAASGPTATIQWVRYEQQMFGTTGARRHIALWDLGIGSFEYYRISGATDPGNGFTETITIDPVAVRTYTVARTVISFLKLCRLEEDLARVKSPNTRVSEATIQVRELPMEAPLV